MAILVAADFDAEAWAAWWPHLKAALPGEQLVRNASACAPETIEMAIVANPPPRALAGLPALRLIQSLWAGVDGLLADASVPTDVPLARMVDPAMSASMAETAVWAALSWQRGFFSYAAQQRKRQWQALAARRAEDIRIAVLGLGQMGRCTAQALLRQGYRVSGWSRSGLPLEGVQTFSGQAELSAVLAAADVVINLLPLTPDTREMFDAQRLSQLPRGACFVNVGRGAQLVEPDLIAALDAGQLSHAVLDVFATEPLPRDHPFWTHPNITVLPHVAAPTDPRSAARLAAENIVALRAGRPLANLVDRRRGY